MKRLAPLFAASFLTLTPVSLIAQDAPLVEEVNPPETSEAEQERDKGRIAKFIENRLSSSSREVRIDGFEGALSSEATIARLSIADELGEWLVMDDVILDWNRSALFRGRIEVERLSAARVNMLRAPVPEDTGLSAETEPFSLPDLPLSVEVDELAVDEVRIGDTLLGEPITAQIFGDVLLQEGEFDTTLSVARIDDKVGQIVAQLRLDEDADLLSLTLLVDEEENGIAARLLNLPGLPSVQLEVTGDAPPSDFTGQVSLDTNGEPRLSGAFNLQLLQGPDGRTGRRLAVDLGGDITPLFLPQYQDFFGDDVQIELVGQARPEGGFLLEDLTLQAKELALTGDVTLGTDGWPESFDIDGTVGAQDAGPVLLPIPGPRTTVDRIALSVAYDAAQSSEWTASVEVDNFARPEAIIPEVALTGGGTIIRPSEGEKARWTLGLDYAARDIETTNEGLAEALGADITGRIEAQGEQGQPTQIPTITLSGPGLELAGNASIAGGDADYRTRLDARLDAEDLGRFSGLAGRFLAGSVGVDLRVDALPLAADYDIRVAGTTADLALGIGPFDRLLAGTGDVDLRVKRDPTGTMVPVFEIMTDEVEVTGNAALTSTSANGALVAEIKESATLSDDLSGPARITARANTDEDSGDINVSVQAALPSARVDLDGTLSRDEDVQSTALTARVEVDDLARYSDLLQRDLNGAIDAKVSGTYVMESSAFDVTIDGTTEDLALGITPVDALLQGDGTLALSAKRDAAGRIQVSDLHAVTDALTASGSGQMTEDGIEATFNARVPDTSLLAADLSGPMQVKGTAGVTSDGATKAELTATGPGTQIALDATLLPPSVNPGDKFPVHFSIDADLDDLSRWSDLAGRPLRGSATAQIEGGAEPATAAFEARVDANTDDLQIGQTLADALLVGEGHLTARVARRDDGAFSLEDLDFATPRAHASGDVRFARGDVAADLTAHLDNVAYLAPGLTGPADFSLTSQAAEDGRTRLNIDGTGPQSSLTGTLLVDDENAALPADFTVALTLPQLSAFRRLAGTPIGGAANLNATGTARIAEGSFTADVNARTRDLTMNQDLLDNLLRGWGEVTGTVSRSTDGALSVSPVRLNYSNLTANGSGTRNPDGTMSGSFNARLPDASIFADQLSGPITAQGTARQSARGTDIDVTASGAGGLQARARGVIARSGRLQMQITGDAPLALLNDRIKPRALEGQAEFDLSLNGPPALSSLGGVIRIDGAQLSAPTIGTGLTNISGTLRPRGAGLAIDLQADVPAGGQIRADGELALSNRMIADISIVADGITLKDPQLYETTADGRITIQGPLGGGALIAGGVVLSETNIRIPSSSLGTLGELPEVRHIDPSAEVRQTLHRAGLSVAGIALGRGGDASGNGARPRSRYPLDVTISAPERIFVRGRGLDAELGGSVTLKGTTRNIIPAGRFELIRGRIDILQQRFDLTEGYATLDGDFTPYLRLVATTETEDGTASIILEGDIAEPDIHFESSPDLPEDEVLSRLIFGRDLSSISPLQAVQLAAAVNTLAGRGNGGLVGQLRNSLDLDDLDITSDEDGSAALRAGKYLSENVYTNVTLDSDGTSRIDLNLDVSEHITVRGGTDTEGDSSVGIYFERDY